MSAEKGRTPDVIALIPDGNRRWARLHSLSILDGYRLGVKKFIEFADWCLDYGVKNIVVWAFSTENFNRPKVERDLLFNIYKRAAHDRELISKLHANRTRFRVVGNRSLLPRDVSEALRKVEVETSCYKDRVLNVLIAYGGRDDILHAATEMAKSAVKRRLGRVTEAVFRSYLLSNSIPNIDFVIRTSGEERLSGFMPMQTGYAELYFSKKLWPDFKRHDLRRALNEYGRRQRRFGT